MPINLWILFITSLLCLRNLLVCYLCMVFCYCVASIWPAGFLCWGLYSHFPILCLVLLFYFYVYFHSVSPQSAHSISLYFFSCYQLCSFLCLYTDLYQVCISLFYHPVCLFSVPLLKLLFYCNGLLVDNLSVFLTTCCVCQYPFLLIFCSICVCQSS